MINITDIFEVVSKVAGEVISADEVISWQAGEVISWQAGEVISWPAGEVISWPLVRSSAGQLARSSAGRRGGQWLYAVQTSTAVQPAK